MAFKVTNPNPCLNNCECSVTSPSKPCAHNDGCLSLCNISAIPSNPNDSIFSIDVLSDEFPHNLSACDEGDLVLEVVEYDASILDNVTITGSVLEWTAINPGFSDILLKGSCGDYSAYMCVTVKSVVLPAESALQFKPTIKTSTLTLKS